MSVDFYTGPADSGPSSLVQWAAAAVSAHEIAGAICQTSFCPEVYRGKPGEATAAILAGAEVGLSPMAALNAFDVIQGRPAPKAITLRAIVQSHGHEVILDTSTPQRCIMRGRRNGAPEWQSVEWTMSRAQGLGLTNKQQWKMQPQTMLVARATSELCRLIAADAILGIPYIAEELGDDVPAPTVTVEAPKATRVRRQIEPPVVPEPELPVEVVEPEPEVVEASGAAEFAAISEAQIRKLGVLMAGKTRDEALAYVSLIVGREVASRKDLSKREASDVIDALEEDAK